MCKFWKFQIGLEGTNGQEFSGSLSNCPIFSASLGNVNQPFIFGHNGQAVMAIKNNSLTVSEPRVGIGTMAPSGALDISPSSGRFIVDDSGRLLTGISSARTNFHDNANYTTQFQLEGTNFQNSALSLVCSNTSVGDSTSLTLAKNGGSTVGSNTLVSNNELFGEIRFEGNDGTNFVQAAAIKSYVDGTPGAGDMPGRLEFHTTADGASSPTERMTIKSNGAAFFSDFTATSGTTGVIYAKGRAGRQGINATAYSNIINFHWTTSATLEAWVDASNVGTVSLTSDYRVKRNIQTQTLSGIDRVKLLRPVTYNMTDFFQGESRLSTQDDIVHEGFIAHEVGEVIPDGCVGEKDSETQLQSLNIAAITSVLTKALQEATERIETLEQRLADAGL